MGTMKRPGVLLAAGILLAAAGLGAQQTTTQQDRQTGTERRATRMDSAEGQLGQAERRFVMKALHGGRAEVEAGKLAQERGSSDRVKEIGRMLVEDHSKAAEELRQIAAKKGMTVRMEQDRRSRRNKEETMGRLATMSGGDFDREFLQRQYRHHEREIRDFEHTAEKTDDPDLRNFASSRLPTLRRHRDMIQNAAQELGVQLAADSGADRTRGRRGDRDADSNGYKRGSGRRDRGGQPDSSATQPNNPTPQP
ncbi:MAG: DUF4142 domain-containing protein [Bryobacteraceae bacterium]|nr:DUF4142 domain-containing protein [Bryobacteraceae bacterium]